ncbi:MAG: response regulator [Rubrivivax sp.]|nr:MAG: response regulator [Rubrivivax sp.]
MQTLREPLPSPVYRVLVADDNHDLADTLGLLLGLAMDCEVEVVYDGQQALDHALASRPDAAIFDLEMPKIDGLHAAHDVRRAFADNPPFMIAMSGNPDTLQRTGQTLTFDRAFCKPFDFEHLVAALQQRGAPLQDH